MDTPAPRAAGGAEIDPGVRSWASLLDDVTRLQAARTARLACVDGHVALMPDAHLGMGATIGSVIPTREALIPSAVGVDIGCGVQALRTTLDAADLPDDLTPLLESMERHVPAGVGQGHDEVADRAWRAFVDRHGEPPESTDRLRRKAPLQFGTLGSGNHFIEVCLDEDERVWLMLHSGSRGIGNGLAQRHISSAKSLAERVGQQLEDRELAWLPEGTPAFDAYVRDLEWAQAYAWENRERMIAVCLRLLARAVGRDDRDPAALTEQSINNHHNYAAREVHHGREVWVTRKGAIRAQHGQLGVIPGSMGTGSFVVRGLGNPASYHSASHGAGRAMSRGQARRQFSAADLEQAMEGRTWLAHRAKDLVDEIPGAYKDLSVVMDDQHDLVEIVHRLTTILNYKGT
jgi:tRNA-splicing ligase RtcB